MDTFDKKNESLEKEFDDHQVRKIERFTRIDVANRCGRCQANDQIDGIE